MVKFKNLIPHFIVFTLATCFYFYIRIFFRQGVFFDFDMPRVALIVQDYLTRGTYLTSQSFMQESVWRNVPWGPALVFFYSVFLKISPDPLIISDLLTVFNYLSIVLIAIIGWRFFSPTVGVLSAILLATNPYWVSYSRIIYQPAPLVTFLVLSMFLTLLSVKEKNKVAAFFIPLTWVVLFQIYIPTYAFIVISLIYLVLNFKNLKIKYFLLGALFSLILIIPSVYFYINNPEYIQRFFEAPSLFTPPEKTVTERVEKVINSFLTIPVGGNFKWQTGYSHGDFVNSFPVIRLVEPVVSNVFLLFICYLFYRSYKEKNKSKFLILSWSIAVVVSLLILWVTDLVPRYFLIAIPPSMLLIAIGINDLMIYFKANIFVRNLLFLIPILISIYWLSFDIKYDNFIKNYNYPNGKMYDVAETPYIHFINSMKFVLNDATSNGCSNLYISNDRNDINTVWMETDYVVRFVFKTVNNIESQDECKYKIVHNWDVSKKENQFGPFIVIKN